MLAEGPDHRSTVDCEGIIPGSYGAGPMICWDRGEIRYLGERRGSHREGKLDFMLHGYKLRALRCEAEERQRQRVAAHQEEGRVLEER